MTPWMLYSHKEGMESSSTGIIEVPGEDNVSCSHLAPESQKGSLALGFIVTRSGGQMRVPSSRERFTWSLSLTDVEGGMLSSLLT